jgi:hypothetical protein
MRLYYMTTLETLEKFILPENRLRVSTFDRVNDPFELLSYRQGDKRQRRHFASLYNHWVKTLGFVSLSESWQSPLMWAHYAQDHTGVCLGFDVADGVAGQVSYEPARLNDLLEPETLERDADRALVQRLATTKFMDWAYEKEWRILINLDVPDPATGLHFFDFTPDFELRQVLIGARCSATPGDIRDQVYANTSEVEIFKVRAAFGDFKMVRQRLIQTLTASPLHRVALGPR